jgi:hypothetical protein
MSAADARKAVALRAEVRDKLVLFIQERCPNAFPKPRVEAIPETKTPTATTDPKS